MTSIDGGHACKRIAGGIHGDFTPSGSTPKIPTASGSARTEASPSPTIAPKRGRAFSISPAGQFYQIFADNRWPFYYIHGGLQDNGTWSGPSRTSTGGILNDDWRNISGGDGFHVVNHPDDPELFLSENQGGGIVRTDWRTREQQDVSPQPKRNDGGPVGETEIPLQLERSHRSFAARQEHRLFRQQRRVQKHGFRQDLGRHQPRSDHQRSREAKKRRHHVDREHHRRISLHDHPHRRIAQAGRRNLGRHRRRQSASDHRRRQALDQCHGQRSRRAEVRGNRLDRAVAHRRRAPPT